MKESPTATVRTAQISRRKLLTWGPLTNSKLNTATLRHETFHTSNLSVSAEAVRDLPADEGFVCDTATILGMAIKETLCITVHYTQAVLPFSDPPARP
jgi:hypothetical protein